MAQERTKILMYRSHIAYIDKNLLQTFDHHCSVVNFSAWIRQQAQYDFGVSLSCKEDLVLLDDAVAKHYYMDKTEWLREKMRNAIKEASH